MVQKTNKIDSLHIKVLYKTASAAIVTVLYKSRPHTMYYVGHSYGFYNMAISVINQVVLRADALTMRTIGKGYYSVIFV